MNEREWDGFIVTKNPVGQLAPPGSSLVYKICKIPLVSEAACSTRIYYVPGDSNMTHACLHLGVHEHLVKVGKD